MKPFLYQDHYINGQWQASEQRYPVVNPANQEVIAQVAQGGAAEAQAAVAAAQAAFPAWKQLTAKERARYLRSWSNLMLEQQQALAHIVSTEQGKPLAEAHGEVAYAASFLEWFAEEGKRAYGDVIPSAKQQDRIVVIKQPVGVVAAITPWNFPLAMITRKAAPALAAGCTMVLKPSRETPLSALALAALAEQAGIPPGVLNVVSGDTQAISAIWQASAVVRKITFTGSTKTGKLLMRQAADTLKRVSLELGNNAPFIVFDDADIDAAIQGAMASKFRNSGQTCMCANRFYVQDQVYEVFVDKMAQAVRQLKVGPAASGHTDQGPLINQATLNKVEAHVADALQKGARLVCGGQRHALGGTFYQPTVLAEANQTMLLAMEETFGPVAACFRFKGESEVIQMANDTQYGLSAYFYSRDIGRIWRVAEALEVGMVGINEGIISNELAPFGGIKESGMGREGSRYGLEDYLNIKYMLMGGLTHR